jgi:hypothetical protein
MRNLAKEVNSLSDPKFCMIHMLQIGLDPIINEKKQIDYSKDVCGIDYSRKIKLLINALIIEAKKWNEEFKKTIQGIFTLSVPNSKSEKRMIEDAKMSMKFREDI